MMELQLSLPIQPEKALDLSGIMRMITVHSSRPRYTFLVLDLIVRAGDRGGVAGPYVRDGGQLVPIREWLAGTIAPSATRHHHRRSTTQTVREQIEAEGRLPDDIVDADAMVEEEVAARIRSSGMTAVSRAVSELVRAGLVKRHYQGYRVDHENRGAQRLAVYTVSARALAALERTQRD
jgi:hypothetical protein